MEYNSIRCYENQKNLVCDKCNFRFGKKLWDKSNTIKEFGGCPKCYQKFRFNGLDVNHSILRNLSNKIINQDDYVVEQRKIIKKQLICV